MPINYRTPTDVVVILGTFNKQWCIQFQNRKKHDREFLRDVLGDCNPAVFRDLEDAFWAIDHYQLKLVDIKLHHCYSTHPEIDEKMQERISGIRKEFNGTYTSKVN